MTDKQNCKPIKKKEQFIHLLDETILKEFV